MKQSRWIALAAAAVLGLGVSAFAQGRSGGHAMGGPPAGAGPGMGGQMGPGMGGPMGQAGSMGPMGQTQRGQMGQMGQTGQMRPQSSRPTVSDLLTQNTKLSSSLEAILGSNVTLGQLQQDASGFKNLGLFVAAVHVSKNLKIPFSQLSSAIQQKHGNLGKAIHSLNPNLSKSQVKDAVRTAKKQGKQDIRHSKS